MDEIILKTTLDDSCCLYVSPIDRETYEEQVATNNLGGRDGYFVMLSRKGAIPGLEVLAKASTVEAAIALFDLIVGSRKDQVRRGSAADVTPLFL